MYFQKKEINKKILSLRGFSRNNFICNYVKAFTLAEILIILGIIGIVASITIPALINNSQKQEFYAALKKEYGVLYSVTNNIVNDNSGNIWTTDMRGVYANYLNVARLDTTGNIFNYQLTAYDRRNGIIDISNNVGVDQSLSWITDFLKSSYPAMVLNDGTAISFRNYSTAGDCTDTGSAWGETQTPVDHYYCGFIQIDVNGAKPPNRIGVDFYSLWIIKDHNNNVKLIPGVMITKLFDGCGYQNADYGWWTAGFGCASYVLQGKTLPKTTQSP